MSMSKMIAYCGLDCLSCPTFIATKNNDDNARRETAAYYAKQYGFNLKPAEINCDGCLSQGGKLLAYCQSCEIRQCCRAKGLANCARCQEQPCEKLLQFHAFSPYAEESFKVLLRDLS